MKQYNGEKAIISLTSWKARISTVAKTIYSLVKQCPGFHIVLVLSEEEFPRKEAELPENLMLFVDNDLLEILWVYKNYKSFKKVLFTMDKYRDVPVISADDDCIYTCNYAQELYDIWVKYKDNPIAYRRSKIPFCPCGPATLYPPQIYPIFLDAFKNYNTSSYQDDGFFLKILKELNKHPIYVKDKFPCVFHDEISPLTGSTSNSAWFRDQSF